MTGAGASRPPVVAFTPERGPGVLRVSTTSDVTAVVRDGNGMRKEGPGFRKSAVGGHAPDPRPPTASYAETGGGLFFVFFFFSMPQGDRTFYGTGRTSRPSACAAAISLRGDRVAPIVDQAGADDRGRLRDDPGKESRCVRAHD